MLKTSAHIGQKVKLLRQARNLSLNDLSKLSGISKAALSKLESGDSNPRIDTLEAIAVALRFPLGDLFTASNEGYPRYEKNKVFKGEYAEDFKFRVGMGNISEIWHLKMIRGAIINSPAHSTGTHEHILIHQGTLMMRFNEDQTVLLKPGDFYAFSCDIPHSYICMEGELSGTLIMSYSHIGQTSP
ncbi:XRE family transcriptional regulator [Morganella morganii]